MSTEAERVLRALDKKSPWVFPAPEKGRSGSTTKQISDRRLLAYLKRILKKLSLPGHVHTFRHAFISNAAVAGVAPDVLRKWVGHVDQATFDLYFHLANDASQQAMARLEEANRRLDATKSTTQNQHKDVCDGN